MKCVFDSTQIEIWPFPSIMCLIIVTSHFNVLKYKNKTVPMALWVKFTILLALISVDLSPPQVVCGKNEILFLFLSQLQCTN